MTNERKSRAELSAEARSRRRAVLLSAAVAEAHEHGYRNITRDGVGARAGIAASNVNHEFGTIDNLREEVLREAIEAGHLDIVRQGIANADPLALAAPEELKSAALATV